MPPPTGGARYVEIAVNVPNVTTVFHYHLPDELESQVKPGHLVAVPFRQQTVYGVVLRFVEQPEVAETRAVLALVDTSAVLTAQQLELADRLASSTFAPLAACIGLMLPPGLMQQADAIYTLNQPAGDGAVPKLPPPGMEFTTVQARLVSLLQKRGPLRGQQIDRAMPRANWRVSMRGLMRGGLVTSQSILPPPRVHPKRVRTAQLACPPEIALKHMDDLGRQDSQVLPRRQAMLRYLLNEPGAVTATWLYAESGGNLQDLYHLAEMGLVSLGETEVQRDPLEHLEYQPSTPPELTPDQQRVWEQLAERLVGLAERRSGTPLLLHGVTGSGKTEIYLRAVEHAIQLGRQAIILVPEIALTPQTIRRFAARFPGQVGMLHSGLSEGERYDTWRRARQGELSLVVGPRSALFTPFPNPGLIILDECHDDSYFQADILPYYDARAAAVAYAQITGAVCLFGSATPDITQAFHAIRGEWGYLHLPTRILAHRQTVQAQLEKLQARSIQAETTAQPPSWSSGYRPVESADLRQLEVEANDLPLVHLVDMRDELKSGNRSIFSQALQESIKHVLDNQLQAILFLNRRGSATYVFCRDCGYSLRCPQCDMPLTYHLGGETTRAELQCHYCGYKRLPPERCPACRSPHIRHYGTGTERVEAEVQALFPQARTLRWDSAATQKKGAHEVILSHFVAQRADILVGTQMLAKGLDLPLVTLVGVVLADVGLNLPDFRAAERTFQVLTQVAGRAGRSPLGGQVILQTFQPSHYVIQAAAAHDYDAFYRQELGFRRKFGYPPFAQIVRIEFRHADPRQVEKSARALAAKISTWIKAEDRRATQMAGPVPCFFARLAGLYRWQIVLRGPDPVSLLQDKPLGECKIEVNPPNLL